MKIRKLLPHMPSIRSKPGPSKERVELNFWDLHVLKRFLKNHDK